MVSDLTANVLVVEDEDVIREALVSLLQEDGCSVAAAPDGETALNYLRKNQPPRLILLDLMMPGMDGWEFRAIQMRTPELAGIPVAVTTGLGSDYRLQKHLQAVEYLTKPYDVQRLLDTVRRYCAGTDAPPPPSVVNIKHCQTGEVLLRVQPSHFRQDAAYEADLSRAELQAAALGQSNLVHFRLTEADLSYSDLTRARLCGADLTRANLRVAELSLADLSNACLEGANLFGADLFGAILRYANLRDAYLGGADLDTADLTGAVLLNTRYDAETRWPEGFDPRTHGAILTE